MGEPLTLGRTLEWGSEPDSCPSSISKLGLLSFPRSSSNYCFPKCFFSLEEYVPLFLVSLPPPDPVWKSY